MGEDIHEDGRERLHTTWDGMDLLVREYAADHSYRQLRVPAAQFSGWTRMVQMACTAAGKSPDTQIVRHDGWLALDGGGTVSVIPPMRDRARYAQPADTTGIEASVRVWTSIVDAAIARIGGLAAPVHVGSFHERLHGRRAVA